MSRHNISHETIIEAPIDLVWKELIAIDDWEWNRWTRLKATEPVEGTSGKLMASYEGDDKWQEFDFTFGPVNESSHILTWQGSVAGGCLFSGYHTMQLESVKEGQTKLIHKEQFGGLLPMIGAGLPYKTLNRNYLLMNESLKDNVEKKAKNKT
ncbi:unnamed protein product [Cylindrotheca closterium]|uniref:Uncharacterized protein n=1 Tax=Cylindrotheca closterium TaxID=2856 RepID=A0AAD2G4V2_9STRA|nr:unnamed protein product [Cylindrotheca closterium]